MIPRSLLPLFMRNPTWILEGKYGEGAMKSTYIYSHVLNIEIFIQISKWHLIENWSSRGGVGACAASFFDQKSLKFWI